MSTPQDPRKSRLGILTSWVESRQLLLRNMLSMGGMTVEREIEMRDRQTKDLLRLFSFNQSIATLQNAIDHVEVILRRLPEGSEQLPRYLDSLSYMKVSEYEISQSASALDQAVELSLRAKDEAERFKLDTKDPAFFFKVLNDLGYAQSHRFGELGSAKDLDDAIQTGRFLLSKAPRDSEIYSIGVLNLASRLRIRYERLPQPEDYDETTQLLKSLVDGSLPPNDGFPKAYISLQLSELSYLKFTIDEKLCDLDDAIRHGTAAIVELDARDSKTEKFLGRLCQMHGDRYDRKQELKDVEQAVTHSRERVLIIPMNHPIRGLALHKHIFYSGFLAKRLSNPAELDDLAQAITELLGTMPESYEQNELCHWLFGDILARRYELNGVFSALTSFLDNADKMCLLHNKRVHAQGEADVNDHKIIWLRYQLRRIMSAPEDNYIRNLTLRELPGYFKTACETNGVPNAAITLWNQQGQRLRLYADAIEANEVLDKESLDRRLQEETEKSKRAEINEQGRRRKNPWRREEYKTEFGVRQLDIDPATKKMIFSVPTIVQDIFGYKSTDPLPLDKFVEQEIQLEAATRQRESAEGKFPNPALCRICRKLRVMVPTDDSPNYRWNPKVEHIPFGNFNQLFLRKDCVICGMILGFVSNHDGHLHAKLAAIDDEIQGTALEPATLENGDQILKVSYGLREVGTIKILDVKKLQVLSKLRGQISPGAENNNTMASAGRPARTLNISRLKRFMNDCDHHHGLECNGPALSGKLAEHISMYQIDVVDQCLVETTSAVKYFALSYVWGSVDMSMTLRCNLDARLQKGGLNNDQSKPLPKTILDAISFVKGLDERFLWVDALCIVQDDHDRKQRDIKQMDLVYSRAFATIVATTGADADAGLPGVCPGTLESTGIRKLRVSNRSVDLAYDPDSKAVEEVYITATPMSLGLVLDASKWESRGWTFQERLLSKRCLFFSNDTVYYQCQKETCSETGQSEPETGPSMSRLQNPLTLLPSLESWKGDTAVKQRFKIYKALVEQYTLRDLTFGGDIMNAFAGVWAVLQPHSRGQIVCGIPAVFLDLALLWTPASTLTRRKDPVSATITPSHSTTSIQTFPSWSWAGYVGPVEFRLLHEDKRPLPAPLISRFHIYHGDWLYTARSRPTNSKGEQSNLMDHEVDSIEEVSHADQAVIRGLTTHGPFTLQFEALVVPVSAFKFSSKPERLSFQDHVHATSEQAVYRLFDQNNKHCGIVFDMLPLHEADQGVPPSFIGIAQYGETKGEYLGPKRVEGNITLFDDEVYPSTGSGSGLVDSLLVAWTKHGVAERRSVARIHAQAWEKAAPLRRAVALG
ncbi:heterokaryon incompatibility protein-domain-containing protein [Paraphoma chrysanthemicola]|nr:heterokaryon incompatibility protein-domain-containing protein [Paraphoma chrysanthemicola]